MMGPGAHLCEPFISTTGARGPAHPHISTELAEVAAAPAPELALRRYADREVVARGNLQHPPLQQNALGPEAAGPPVAVGAFGSDTAARAAALEDTPVGIQKRRVLGARRHSNNNGRLQMLDTLRRGPAARALADFRISPLTAVVFSAGDDPSLVYDHRNSRGAPATNAIPHAINRTRLP